MNLDSAVESAIVQKIESLGFECWEVKFFTAGGKSVLRIFADTDEGISMDQCAEISHGVSDLLDSLDFGNDEYTLEVSSPGLDRPLTTERDFRRFTGKEVQIRYKDETGKSCKQTGAVLKATEDSVTLTFGGETRDFRYDEILSGKLVF